MNTDRTRMVHSTDLKKILYIILVSISFIEIYLKRKHHSFFQIFSKDQKHLA